MQLLDDQLLLAPTDVTKHLACPRLTALDRDVALGRRTRPWVQRDPHLELIRTHGDEHEAAHLARLVAQHGAAAVVEVARPEKGSGRAGLAAAAAQTEAAMRSGAQVVFQAVLLDGAWRGFADFLVRVEAPSGLGAWSYEVVETKLARSLKPAAVHQLARYSLGVGALQGVLPVEAHVVLGTGEHESFVVREVLALHRHAAARLEAALAADAPAPPPEPVDHCGMCDWARDCNAILRAQDHLGFVATLGRDQRAKLEDEGVHTLAQLAALGPDAPHGALSAASFARVRVQAQLQELTRDTGALQHRHLAAERARGYATLPHPSPGDVFFDLEGDPFAGPEGLEYLWGWEELSEAGVPEYSVLWAHDEPAEQRALEAFVDHVQARRALHPGLRVFHYAPHELSTLRRLSDKYATRTAEVDAWQREGVLVDLYAVVRQAVQVGQEGYGLKTLEPFYAMTRTSTIREGGGSIVAYEAWLGGDPRDPAILDEIAAYNAEDCRSTRLLRDRLLAWRDEAAAEQEVDFEALRDPEPEAELTDPEWVPELQALQDELERGLPAEAADDTAGEAARRLLASLLFYHRREQKPQWWRFFALQDMTAEQLEVEPDAISGLVPDPEAEPFPDKRSTCTWLTFPPQEQRLKPGSAIDPLTGDAAGEILDVEPGRVLLRQGPKAFAAGLPGAIVGPKPLDTKQQRGALTRAARALLDDTGEHPAVGALLRRVLPRVAGRAPGTPLVDGPVTVDDAIATTLGLGAGCLAVQGPPGAGKTYTGARLVVAAIRAGRRVAVSATSHKAIHNLLCAIEQHAHDTGLAIRARHKHSDDAGIPPSAHGMLESSDDNADLDDLDLQLVSGTPWLLSRGEHEGAFDLLVIDEAGQMALADAAAIATCAGSVVLLGDPQQLPQVAQGTHPEGAGASVLQHVLGDRATVEPERGLFLGETWRMHPDITAYVSERFYDGRLGSVPGCAGQRIDASRPLTGAGLRLLSIPSAGRSQSSPEEAEAIAAACRALLAGGRATTRERGEQPLRPEDILVVAPYNLAVRCIAAAVPEGVRVGTVDRFQGQEAPVVFYAMTSSTGADAPRGLDFLFQPNRLDVAISRAQCLAVLVASPRLLESECRTLEQMRMLDHACRYAELAVPVSP